MTVLQIFNKIANESSTNVKMAILEENKDNELLKEVLYLANSRRVKFHIKQIPDYDRNDYYMGVNLSGIALKSAIDKLSLLSERKVTGGAAIQHLKTILEEIDEESAIIIERIIEKDCKIGLGTRMINKVFPDLIEKTGYMGCKPYSKELITKLLSKGAAFSQEKMDGRFLNAVIQGHEVTPESRQGEPTILDNAFFLSELALLDDCVLNGELTMNDKEVNVHLNIGETIEIDGIIHSISDILEKFSPLVK